MKQLSSFMVLNIDGGDRVSYTYNEVDSTGELKGANIKKNFIVVDQGLEDSINTIRDYIRQNKLEG